MSTLSQSRLESLVETVTSTAIGFGVSYCINVTLFYLYGFEASSGTHFLFVSVFTVASLIRGYFVRRLFNGYGWRSFLVRVWALLARITGKPVISTQVQKGK